MQRLRHYEAPVTINVPLQVALGRQNLDRVVVGGVDGAVRVYDRTTGELVCRLRHKAMKMPTNKQRNQSPRAATLLEKIFRLVWKHYGSVTL
jgi:hypothetical protein